MDNSDDSDDPLLYVPVRGDAAGFCVLRTFRRPDGVRTGVAFTSMAALTAAMGPGARHAEVALAALHAMLVDVGVESVLVDPDIVADVRPGVRLVS